MEQEKTRQCLGLFTKLIRIWINRLNNRAASSVNGIRLCLSILQLQFHTLHIQKAATTVSKISANNSDQTQRNPRYYEAIKSNLKPVGYEQLDASNYSTVE
jgi:hypothetical protein